MVFQVQEIKAELNNLGDSIEEVRSICRQLHTHLRKIPECTIIPFESEADALMDRWLDVSFSHSEHLTHHFSLILSYSISFSSASFCQLNTT